MSDTPPAIQARYEQMLMARSAGERLLMGCSMFDMAKKMARSSILARSPGIGAADLRKELFLRFYGHEFSECQQRKILEALKKD